MEQTLWMLAGVIVTTLVALFIVPLVQDQAEDWAVNVLGRNRFRRKQNLSGSYRQTWTTTDSASTHKQSLQSESPARIRHLSKRVTGFFVFDNQEYRIKGHVCNDYIVGEWHDALKGSMYFGVFQLKIEVHTGRLKGMWIGHSRTGDLRYGDWIWTPTESIRSHGIA